MILVAHAVVDGVVSGEDGEHVMTAVRHSLLDWLAGKDIKAGDHILIVRGVEDD